ncbi:MAG: DNA cytosine methyltransferase [Chloroflexi bacterium]|nr:DNA cytosine methyltransferase [Chloroflexota bacterium]
MLTTTRRRGNKLTALDLFSGCGGLTLGLKRAGFNVIGAVDNDALSVETYRANHPRVKLWDVDIRELDVRDVKHALGIKKRELDLLAGCPPCQGFSSLRTRNGSRTIDDERNDLIFEFLRFVHELRPKTVMMENVPALKDDRRFARFCIALRAMRYRLNFSVCNAADYGVPQRRWRLILLASRRGAVELPTPLRSRRNVRAAIGSMLSTTESDDPLHIHGEKRSPRIRRLIRRIPLDGGGRSALGDDQLGCHKRMNGFKDIYGRMAWDSASPTITTGCTNPSKGRFLHPEEHRAITVREAALIQGFPTGYYFTLSGGKSGAAAMIGNALPPNFGKWQAVAVRTHLGGN